MKPGDIVKIINHPDWEHLGIGIILGFYQDSFSAFNVYWSGDGNKRVFYVNFLEKIS
jgi:hypothetical protein